MRSTRLVRATIVVVAASVAASGQTVQPESLSYMSRLFRLTEVALPEHLQYSRDGKWLAFDARANGGTARHIFLMPAKGGTPTIITAGARSEIRPMWTAAGDRLAFYRAGEGGAVLTIGIDPATGHPTGPAKRVTIDSLHGGAFDVAPDGRSIAYLTPVGASRFDLRIVPISGGPARTLASTEGDGGYLRFDRDGNHIYFLLQRLGGTPRKGLRARDVRRISTSRGAPTTVFTIPEGMMGVELDPIADRVVVRDGDRAYVLTLAGDSVATIPWVQGFRNVSNLGSTPDGSSLASTIDATQSSIHVIPLDGGQIRAITDGSSYPWPDYWVGGHIFLSDADHGAQTLLAPDGTKRSITFDVRKANDGAPLRVVDDDPFPDGVHYAVKALDAAGDTSLFVYDSRTGDAKRITQRLRGSRAFAASGPGDDYFAALGEEIFYRNVRNGVAEIHSLDTSGRDHIVQSFPLPKQTETVAFAPGRMAHAYARGDTAYLDVTIGSGKPVRALARPGARMREIVFNRDGSSLYADVVTGKNPNAHSRGAFFSTADARSLDVPARWVETVACWHPTWLPDGTGVLEVCANETSTKTWVSRIPASGPATPQPLTQRETSIFWDYTMSPDGKYVAVPAEKNSGMDLWRIDLRAAANARRGPEQ